MAIQNYGTVASRNLIRAAQGMLEHAQPITVLGDFGTQREMPQNSTDTLVFRRTLPFGASAAGTTIENTSRYVGTPDITASNFVLAEGVTPNSNTISFQDVSVQLQQYGVLFKKKQMINKAIVKFDSMTPERKRKVARLLGLPVTDDTKEEAVYNLVDNVLKQTEFKNGKYQGLNPVEVFTRFADMKENLLHIKDLVKQAIAHSVYRVRPNGRVYEGEFEIAADEDELIKFLADEDNQDQLLTLEGKLKSKKIAST